jgi:hypothetical protein
VRARAASTRAATRREVEQSIARFEKRLDESNDALKTLGTHLGRGAQGSYKEVTAALAALRREATKTNKQALKDFDKLRSAVTRKPAAAKSNSAAKASTAKTSAAKKSSGSAKASSSSTSKRTTAKRSTASRAKTTRSKKTS